MESLDSRSATISIINGLGGQGKSLLAAEYLKRVNASGKGYDYWDWRDCREEGDKIRTQIIAILERFTPPNERQSYSTASDDDLCELLLTLSKNKRIAFVLDNVDYYVDLENNKFVGILDKIVVSFHQENVQSRLIITCRPKVFYDYPSVVLVSLSGLSLAETIDLFRKRISNKRYG